MRISRILSVYLQSDTNTNETNTRSTNKMRNNTRKPLSKRRSRLFAICSGITLVAFFVSCSSSKDKDEKEQSVSTVLPDRETEVSVVRLEPADFHHELISNGTLSAARKADLRFQTSSENIAGIYVKNGDRVKKGQKLAELDQFKLQNSLAQSKDNLERAKLELQDVLIGQGYSPNDTARVPAEVMRIAKVKSGYDQSLASYQLAEYNLKAATLYAPFDGVVANLSSKQDNLPASSEAFCSIIDNLRPEVIFTVLENELPLIKPGDKVLVLPFALPGYATEGHISEINPSIDKNGLVRVKALVQNKDNKLYDGMNVKVKVQRRLANQLIIPKEALVLRTNRKVVFTYKNGAANWVYVETGAENSTHYVVTEGLAAGDSVIYEGNLTLAHEARVKLRTKN